MRPRKLRPPSKACLHKLWRELGRTPPGTIICPADVHDTVPEEPKAE